MCSARARARAVFVPGGSSVGVCLGRLGELSLHFSLLSPK